MKIYDIDESHSILDFTTMTVGEALELKIKLTEALSCYVDGYQFMPSYRAGVFDGKKYYFDITAEGNMKIPKGLVQSVIRMYQNSMTNVYQPLRVPEQVTLEVIEAFIPTLDLPFSPRDYQTKAVVDSINQPRRINLAATSSGKSLIIYILFRYFMSKGMKGLLIVPNVGLVEQMFNDFADYNFKEVNEQVHIIYAGKDKHFDKPMTVTTWQSGIRMQSSDYEQLDFVMIDEAHLAKGDSLQL